MFRVLAGALALGAALAATVFAQSDPTLTPAWSLTTGFASPESAFYDAGVSAIFVSSINGQVLDKDGNGYITRLSPGGQVVAEKWATGLNAPKGLRSAGRSTAPYSSTTWRPHPTAPSTCRTRRR
jgi:hypothetical protein